MNYSNISLIALIINLIINRGFFKIIKNRSALMKSGQAGMVRYGYFLMAANLYFVADFAWGILYENHQVQELFPFLYSDTVLYFAFMFITTLTWVGCIVTYMVKVIRRAKILLYVVWALFILALIYLMVNHFYPFLFSFNEAHEYIPGNGRHIAFALQILLYALTSVYALNVAAKAAKSEKIRYAAIGFTCASMGVFVIIQILDPKYPSYAAGLIIGICVMHSFVEAGEHEEKEVYDNIARGLADNYDVIYYVDVEDSSFISYELRNIYGEKDIQRAGDDFYAESLKNIPDIVHKNDLDLVLDFIDRDHMISALKDCKRISIDYRIAPDNKIFYVRMTARKTGDGRHFIIGIENIDAEIRREKQHLKALNTEKELARRDDLTGVKNKTAYNELEKSVQSNIDNGMDYLPFALVVCDANNLKSINDTEGHVAGDEYIKKSAMLLCDIFVHSPVFRVGGDEFAVFLRGSDYLNRAELMNKLRKTVLENQASGSDPVLASGMSDYLPDSDVRVSEIFDRADKEMYENKQSLKGAETL